MSNRGSNDFWALAVKSFPKLLRAKELERRTRKIPGFRSIRKKLHKNHIPKIMLDVCYEVKETGDMIILKDLEAIPVKKFPPSKYRKMYETAKVKVILNKKTIHGVISISTIQCVLTCMHACMHACLVQSVKRAAVHACN